MAAPSRRETVARFAAPALFLLALTVLVLLVKSALGGDGSGAPTLPVSTAAATTSAVTTTPARPAATKPTPQYYVIRSGDTFGTVAAQFDTTVEALQALNPGVSSNSLTIGQRIRVK